MNREFLILLLSFLLSKAVETRKERKEATLARGRYEFNKNLRPLVPDLPDEAKRAAEEDFAFVTRRLNAVADLYAPKRAFRRRAPLGPDADEESRVRSTLLEFGEWLGAVDDASEKAGVEKSGWRTRDTTAFASPIVVSLGFIFPVLLFQVVETATRSPIIGQCP